MVNVVHNFHLNLSTISHYNIYRGTGQTEWFM